MNEIREDVGNWLRDASKRAAHLKPKAAYEHVGTVERVGDGVANVSGLPWTRLGELVKFADGSNGLALRVDEEVVGCVLISGESQIKAGSRASGTGQIVRVPVGDGLLGRVVDATGLPLDDGPEIVAGRMEPIERPAPAIVDRDLVTSPLMTGLIAIDSMIPLGRGQRELIIGDRKTGKTAIAIDTMINQRSSDVICVYVAIGQKSSTVSQVVNAVRQYGAIERCIFVIGEAEASPGAQWIAPYAACTMAEYFRDRGQDALLLIDDLTKHAIIYRQLSLLLRNPPGREAFPGDVFYLHARLLERAAKLSNDLGGGSLTALPIAETQAGNLTAYIPTNLISITDGQIYLEPKLFYEGQKPAINVGMSVSRVGGKTQNRAMRNLSETLRLEYAQFLELEVFTRFGAIVDERTERKIEHGRRIRAILAQPEYRPLTLAEQIALLLAVGEGLFDKISLGDIENVKKRLPDWLSEHCPRTLATLERTGELSADDRQRLLDVVENMLAQTVSSATKSD